MKKIYIVLTHTGTILSKIIKSYTKDEFSHISIALDRQLQEMYSFGRLHSYNPFWGGFVHEYIDKGTYKRFYKTITRVYSYEVTEEQYEKLKNNIKQIETKKEDYKFNMIGLFAVGFHKKIGKEHSFYCAEFVKYVIEKADINMNLPTVIKPEDFKNVNGIQEIYSGFLRKYNYSKTDANRILIENLSPYTQKEEVA